MFSLVRWLLVTDWQEQGCILWLSTALRVWMGRCWFLSAEGWSHHLLLLHGKTRGKAWSSVVVRAWVEVFHKQNSPSVKHCCHGLAYLQLGPPELIWWSIASGPLCRQTWAWRKGEACSLCQAWLELAQLSQDTPASLAADHTLLSHELVCRSSHSWTLAGYYRILRVAVSFLENTLIH